MTLENSPKCEDLDGLPLPLRTLTDEIEALGRLIDRLKTTRNSVIAFAPFGAGDLLAVAEMIYRFRRIRDAVFGEPLFSDPSWDMLLDLFIADQRGKEISVSSACIAAAAPSTTALRHLSNLVTIGLVQRVQCHQDARVVHVKLTSEGQDRIVRVLSSCSDMVRRRLAKI